MKRAPSDLKALQMVGVIAGLRSWSNSDLWSIVVARGRAKDYPNTLLPYGKLIYTEDTEERKTVPEARGLKKTGFTTGRPPNAGGRNWRPLQPGFAAIASW